MSDALSTYSCIAPTQPKKPFRADGTKTTILIKWTSPSDDGGCPILGYKLYRDSGDSVSDINIQIEPSYFDGKPFLNSYNLQLTSADTGKMYRFQVLAFNYEGFQISNTGTFIIATIPDKPLTNPVLDVSQSDGERLKVSIGEFVTSQNGGADIVSYEI
jgi:hypothetical protein